MVTRPFEKVKMMIIGLAIIAISLKVVIGPLVLSKISGFKITKFSVLYLLIVNSILFFVFSNLKFSGYVQEFFEPMIYFGLLQIFRPSNIRINLFYTAYTVSFVYFIRMFFSSLVFGGILGDDTLSVIIGGILGYLCVIPAQYCLLKCLGLVPRHFIISDQAQESVSIVKEEKAIEKKQNKLIWYFNGIMILLYLINNVFRFSDNHFKIHYQHMLVSFVFLFFLFIYSINSKYKEWEIQRLLKYKDYLLSNLDIYTKAVDASYQSTRNFRHDFANILISMRKTIATESVEGIRQTYEDILEQSNLKLKESQKEVAKLSNIRVLELKSVISEKILKAEARGITVELEISGIIYDLLVEKIDIVRLFGIMLDNAIEAVSVAEMDKPLIRLAIFDKDNVRHYIVENEMVEEELPVRKFIKDGVTTKGRHRGHGLANLVSIMASYPRGIYQISAKDYKFKVEIELER